MHSFANDDKHDYTLNKIDLYVLPGTIITNAEDIEISGREKTENKLKNIYITNSDDLYIADTASNALHVVKLPKKISKTTVKHTKLIPALKDIPTVKKYLKAFSYFSSPLPAASLCSSILKNAGITVTNVYKNHSKPLALVIHFNIFFLKTHFREPLKNAYLFKGVILAVTFTSNALFCRPPTSVDA